MKFGISDLLDDLQEVRVDITPDISVSTDRIKELTMRKIHEQGKYEAKPPRSGFTRRLLIAAAILTALAVPALAVSGGWFSDWLAVTEDHKDTLNFHIEEADQEGMDNWAISGWFIEMWSEEVTATGMTLVCNEFSNDLHGMPLTTDEGYWIEKWNGCSYEKMEEDVPAGETVEIGQKTRTNWTVDWSDTYGPLESGYYRIGKSFTCGSETNVFYATFRVFTEEMEPYIRKCNDSLAEMLASDSWHMTWTQYRIFDDQADSECAHSEMEIWRDGEDYLRMDTVYDKDGSLYRCFGSMFRDGTGYSNIHWAGETVDSQILDWKTADYIDHSNFDLWPSGMGILENMVGQVCDNGNQIIAIEYSAPLGDGVSDMTKEEILEQWPLAYHDYTEKTFTFDENGNLTRIHTTVQTAADVPDGEKVLYQVLEIHDTPADEIAEVIDKQDLSHVKTFSFGDDYGLYQEIGRTEGFVNTEKVSPNSADEVIELARKELDAKKDPNYKSGYFYNCASAYYDAQAEMWKVEFWFSQDSEFKDFMQIVYLDTNGITKLVVYP